MVLRVFLKVCSGGDCLWCLRCDGMDGIWGFCVFRGLMMEYGMLKVGRCGVDVCYVVSFCFIMLMIYV